MESLGYVILVLIGLFAGLVGGLLGVGGSIVMIPAMTELMGPDQHLYQSAAMIVNFFVVVPAVYQHRRANAINTHIVARLVPIAVVAGLLGVGISELPFFAGDGETYLRVLFGLFLIAVAVSDLRHAYRRRRGAVDHVPTSAQGPNESRQAPVRLIAAVAIPMGLVAGLLGVGGGILAVPLQRRFLGLPIRNAIANSAAVIIPTSLIGAIAKNYAFMVERDGDTTPLVLAAVLIPMAIVGSLIGSRLTHRAPLKLVRTAFFLLLMAAAIRMTYSATRSIERRPKPTANATSFAWISNRSSLCLGPVPPNR